MSHAYLDKLAAEAGVTEQLRETPLLTYHVYVDKDGNELGSDDVITIALEHLVQKASDAMREKCAYSMEDYLDDPILSGHGYANGAGEEIRALPNVTLEDLK